MYLTEPATLSLVSTRMRNPAGLYHNLRIFYRKIDEQRLFIDSLFLFENKHRETTGQMCCNSVK